MLYYTIDEETGERIPKQNVDKSMPVPAYTEDIDLSKELAELGEIADFLGENQSNEGGYFNQPTTYSNLCSPTEQQNSGKRDRVLSNLRHSTHTGLQYVFQH